MLLLFILYVSCNEGDCQAAKPSPGSLEFYSLEYEEWPMQDFYWESCRADYRHINFALLSPVLMSSSLDCDIIHLNVITAYSFLSDIH